MKKMWMLVASVAMAVALMGCGGSKGKSGDAENGSSGGVGSARGVAERFVNAVIKLEVDKAVACFDIQATTKREEKEMKEMREKMVTELGRKIDDDKLEGKAILEDITGGKGYEIVNGKKYADQAQVIVQFVKGKDKKSKGLKVSLVLVDGSWKVGDFDEVSGLDTSED